MSAEILTITPISGEFPERHFGKHFTSRLWVKFTDNESQEWVACFPGAYDGGLCLALTNSDNTRGFVVAGGQGYLIDIQTKTLVLELDDYPSIESVITTSNPDYFLVGTFYSIYVLNNSGLVEEVKSDLIIDSIHFKGQRGNVAIGDLVTPHDDESVNFEFDLTTFQLTLNDSGLMCRLWKRISR